MVSIATLKFIERTVCRLFFLDIYLHLNIILILHIYVQFAVEFGTLHLDNV